MLFIVLPKLFQLWPLEALQLAPVSLQHTPSPCVVFCCCCCFVLFSISLFCGTTRCSVLVFIFPALDCYQPFLQELGFGRQEARDVDHKPLRHRGCPGCLGEFICSTEEGHTWSHSVFLNFAGSCSSLVSHQQLSSLPLLEPRVSFPRHLSDFGASAAHTEWQEFQVREVVLVKTWPPRLLGHLCPARFQLWVCSNARFSFPKAIEVGFYPSSSLLRTFSKCPSSAWRKEPVGQTSLEVQ